MAFGWKLKKSAKQSGQSAPSPSAPPSRSVPPSTADTKSDPVSTVEAAARGIEEALATEDSPTSSHVAAAVSRDVTDQDANDLTVSSGAETRCDESPHSDAAQDPDAAQDTSNPDLVTSSACNVASTCDSAICESSICDSDYADDTENSDLLDALDLSASTDSTEEPDVTDPAEAFESVDGIDVADASQNAADNVSSKHARGARTAAATGRTDPKYLNQLLQRMNSLLGPKQDGSAEDGFVPREPESLGGAGLTDSDVERIILKLLLARGSASGRKIAQHVSLPFNLVDPILQDMKAQQLVTYRGAAAMGDYDYTPTEYGRERARRYNEECTYFGAAPVSLRDYLKAMEAQSITKARATVSSLHEAFADLIMNKKMLDRLGPAINSGRGMFLYGQPGNGKTSIAERVTNCFGSNIWIPKALGIDGDIIRLYDPGIHEVIEEQQSDGLLDVQGIDRRWMKIRRPTVIVGGELTMAELEVKQNSTTHICEAPLQLKSNCGTLVIDDFGRQRMPVSELLNRWIVPLEKRYDFLNLPCGKKVQVPFDQIIIFSTNLEPRDLVDGAFLRRIPYKIEVPDPTAEEFHAIMERIAPNFGFRYDRVVIEELIEKHYRAVNRPFRSCQPRDLLIQIKNYCVYHDMPRAMTIEAFDFAVDNYFSVM